MTPSMITVAHGDGIGPEIMRATLGILTAARAPIAWDEIEIGEAVYRKGVASGIPADAWSVLRANRCLLKAPITTPQGKGFKSVNVTLRKSLNLFANVRPCKSYSPCVASHHPAMNLVLIRENEEDLYAGVEYRQSPEVVQALKLVTWPGSERIVRYAFEYARAHGRKKITCMTKDNILKLSDGLFHRVFDEVAAGYPGVQAEHQIVDIGAARLAARPEALDVVVTLNLYGDILSDIASEVAGSVGLGGSANIGSSSAMFEAVHGSAPDIAGQDRANPSGLLSAAVQMLVHLGHGETAERVQNAWLCTLEDGVHTADIYRDGLSRERAGTRGFADAVIARLGRTPRRLDPVAYRAEAFAIPAGSPAPVSKSLVGVDLFLEWTESGRNPSVLGRRLAGLVSAPWRLSLITNRGVKVYPDGLPETYCADQWRCRFLADPSPVAHPDVIRLQQRLVDAGLDLIKTENLYTFDGVPGFSPGQGE
ncbi:MAG: NADP-dependent isocitrate dehydrogenase [Desulfobacterales bacterium]